MSYSEEKMTRFKGGDIGWLQVGKERYRWPDAVVESGFALSQVGQFSQVIETTGGYYLLKKLRWSKILSIHLLGIASRLGEFLLLTCKLVNS